MYFKSDKTEAAIRKEYLELCKLHHPDIGGSEETMKAINNEYEARLESVNGEETKDNAGKSHFYKFDSSKERAIMDMIRKLQNLRLPSTVEIALIGTWIWVLGDTKPHSIKLNKKTGIGLSFHAQKLCWYWHQGHYYSGKNQGNFGGMAMRYGYSKIANSMKDSGKYLSH